MNQLKSLYRKENELDAQLDAVDYRLNKKEYIGIEKKIEKVQDEIVVAIREIRADRDRFNGLMQAAESENNQAVLYAICAGEDNANDTLAENPEEYGFDIKSDDPMDHEKYYRLALASIYSDDAEAQKWFEARGHIW